MLEFTAWISDFFTEIARGNVSAGFRVVQALQEFEGDNAVQSNREEFDPQKWAQAEAEKWQGDKLEEWEKNLTEKQKKIAKSLYQDAKEGKLISEDPKNPQNNRLILADDQGKMCLSPTAGELEKIEDLNQSFAGIKDPKKKEELKGSLLDRSKVKAFEEKQKEDKKVGEKEKEQEKVSEQINNEQNPPEEEEKKEGEALQDNKNIVIPKEEKKEKEQEKKKGDQPVQQNQTDDKKDKEKSGEQEKKTPGEQAKEPEKELSKEEKAALEKDGTFHDIIANKVAPKEENVQLEYFDETGKELSEREAREATERGQMIFAGQGYDPLALKAFSGDGAKGPKEEKESKDISPYMERIRDQRCEKLIHNIGEQLYPGGGGIQSVTTPDGKKLDPKNKEDARKIADSMRKSEFNLAFNGDKMPKCFQLDKSTNPPSYHEIDLQPLLSGEKPNMTEKEKSLVKQINDITRKREMERKQVKLNSDPNLTETDKKLEANSMVARDKVYDAMGKANIDTGNEKKNMKNQEAKRRAMAELAVSAFMKHAARDNGGEYDADTLNRVTDTDRVNSHVDEMMDSPLLDAFIKQMPNNPLEIQHMSDEQVYDRLAKAQRGLDDAQKQQLREDEIKKKQFVESRDKQAAEEKERAQISNKAMKETHSLCKAATDMAKFGYMVHDAKDINRLDPTQSNIDGMTMEALYRNQRVEAERNHQEWTKERDEQARRAAREQVSNPNMSPAEKQQAMMKCLNNMVEGVNRKLDGVTDFSNENLSSEKLRESLVAGELINQMSNAVESNMAKMDKKDQKAFMKNNGENLERAKGVGDALHTINDNSLNATEFADKLEKGVRSAMVSDALEQAKRDPTNGGKTFADMVNSKNVKKAVKDSNSITKEKLMKEKDLKAIQDDPTLQQAANLKLDGNQTKDLLSKHKPNEKPKLNTKAFLENTQIQAEHQKNLQKGSAPAQKENNKKPEIEKPEIKAKPKINAKVK